MKTKTHWFKRWLRLGLLGLRRRPKLPLVLAILSFALVLVLHIWLARSLVAIESNDGDGKIYSQLAVNMLDQGAFSVETQPPFNPTLIRLPGYPLFLAGVFYFAGNGNFMAVAVVQAVFDSLIAVLAAAIAAAWVEDRKWRRKAIWAAFFLMAICPFTAVYTAMVLTETLTTFLMAAMTLTATLALKSSRTSAQIFLLIVTGLVAGTAVVLRPDSGLFAMGIGLVFLIYGLIHRPSNDSTFRHRVLSTVFRCLLFSIGFVIPLVPWTVRNERVFSVFQPLAPTHAEMPGEFVPDGYHHWLRTWIDDHKYIGPLLWNLEDHPIKFEQLPEYAFDSPEEKARVAALVEKYNHSDPNAPQDSRDDSTKTDPDSDNGDGSGDDERDNETDTDEDSTAENTALDLKISPEVDAGFEQIAQERVGRAKFRYYFWLPVKRSAGMWFDTHSMYYPFDGELFPLKDLDLELDQEIWLPVFAVLVWIYTLLAVIGAIFMLREKESRIWVLFAALMMFPRILFFGTLENPEPRYVVELFVYTAILGGIALSKLRVNRRKGSVGVEIFYGREDGAAQ